MILNQDNFLSDFKIISLISFFVDTGIRTEQRLENENNFCHINSQLISIHMIKIIFYLLDFVAGTKNGVFQYIFYFDAAS